MLAEIITGWIFGSMALFSDGLHMGTHVSALSISLFSYILARKYAKDIRYTFGTWKFEILGAYTSALILGLMGLFVLIVSIKRFFNPVKISYDYALLVAVIGLLVNVVCAFILRDNNKHEHNKDLNLKSAYLHVIVDALTSILAIIALLGAKYFNLNFLDPLMGFVSSFLIFRWTYFLIKDSSAILLDKQTNPTLVENIIQIIESDGKSKVIDLHLWKLTSDKYACIVSIDTSGLYSIYEYKDRLKKFEELAHINVELHKNNGNLRTS